MVSSTSRQNRKSKRYNQDEEERDLQSTEKEDSQPETEDHEDYSSEHHNRQTQDNYESRDQLEEEEEDNHDSLEASQTQKKRKSKFEIQRSKKLKSTVDISGAIESVELENFMCHSRLKCSFNNKLNFVIGHNGSGKSAIMTGILICLGGRAKFTNRGESLKSFIKEGTFAATITVRIYNAGPDAYNHEVYGDFIEVIRRITREGVSTYKIKSCDGKTVSTKKEELYIICDMLQIQVDNPLTVLTQDTARQFLASSTPKDLYKFFSKGTNLAQLSEEYNTLADKLQAFESTLVPRGEMLNEMKKEVKKWEEKWKAVEHAREVEERLKELQNEIIWAEVEDDENEIKNLEKTKRKAEKKSEGYQTYVAEFQSKVDEADSSIQELRKSINETQSSTEPLRQRLRELKDHRNVHENNIKSVDMEARNFQYEMNNIQNNQLELTDRLRQIQEKRMASGRDSEMIKKQLKEERNRQIALIDENIREIEKRLCEQENHERQLRETTPRCEERVQYLRNRINESTRIINQISSQCQGNRLAAYGERTNDIRLTIEDYAKKGRWTGMKPLGPIGTHLKLKYQNFSDVIETLLTTIVGGYVVENQQDLKTLQEIFAYYKSNQIPIFKFNSRQVFDYSHGEPDRKYLTVARALDIDSPIITSLLVVNSKIEQNILVETRQEGDALSGRGFPNNCSGIFTKDCRSMGHRMGGYAIQNLFKYVGAPRIAMNLESRLNDEKRKKKDLDDDLNTCNRDLNKMKQEMGDVQNQIRNLKNDKLRLHGERDMVEDELQKLEVPAIDHGAADLEQIENAISDNDDKLKTLQGQINALNDSKTHWKQLIQNIDRNVKGVTQEMQMIETQISNYESEITELTRNKNSLLTNGKSYTEKNNAIVKEIDNLNQEIESKSLALQVKIHECNQICERVAPRATTENIDLEIKSLEARIREHEKVHGNREKVFQTLTSKKEEYKNLRKTLKGLSAILEEFKNSQNLRNELWAYLRRYISSRARNTFGELMSKRGYTGSLELDHDEKKLQLKVETNKAASATNNSGRDTRSLSGGEKSFSTICLLLALWDSIGSPFRALDEFDVFMDAVNRKMSMKLLIGHAREQEKDCQYIFITPQDMGALASMNSNDIRIIRLRDPERSQSTLRTV